MIGRACRSAALLAVCWAFGTTAGAAASAAGTAAGTGLPDPARCAVPDELMYSEAGLPHLAERLFRGVTNAPVNVVVLGAGSSAGVGVSSVELAYPARLAADLERLFAGRRFEVRTLARRGARVAKRVAPACWRCAKFCLGSTSLRSSRCRAIMF